MAGSTGDRRSGRERSALDSARWVTCSTTSCASWSDAALRPRAGRPRTIPAIQQGPDDPDQPDSDDEGDKANDDGTPDEPAAADDDETGAADRDDEPKPAAPAGAGRPTSLASRRRRRSAGTPPPKTGPRPVGGPDDGAGPPSVGHIVRRAGIGIALIAILAILVLFAAGINLWTDAIWYTSVGYDSVFWTRLGVQAGLFVGAGLLALIVLLGNLLLANRLTPPVDPERPGRLKTVAGRLVDAQRQAERSARSRATGGTLGPFGAAGARSGGGELSFSFDAEDMPDVVPLGTWAIAGVAVLLALGVAGAVTGAWETLLLWIHRVPFSPTQTVVDPIFGRDISFFLFELPFYRLVQSLVNGLLLASLVVAGARYLLATTRGGEVFVTRVRVHLAVLGGLYLLSVAFGYQLDKYELVYSQAGANAITGVAFADANARFLAYDVLTFLSGLAGALLIAGAFTRWMWPLAVILIVWFSASIVLGRLYPEAIQRFSVDPNTYAQETAVHREQHLDDAPRVRARPMAVAVVWRRGAADRGGDPERGGHVHERSPVGLPPPADDPRPAPGGPPVLRLPRRGHRPLPDRRHAAAGDAVGARAGDRQGPGRAQLGQPAGHQDARDRRRDGARQRGHP